MSIGRFSEGYAILTAFLILILFTVMGASLSMYMRNSLNSYPERIDHKQKMILINESEKIIDLILKDPTPLSDSPSDPVWGIIGNDQGIHTELVDLSSKINPNWIRKEIISSTPLSGFLKSDGSMEELQKFRYNFGFSEEIDHFFRDFFSDEAFRNVLSPFSYANINTADEFSLQSLYAIRTGSEQSSRVFRGKIQSLRVQKKTISAGELSSALYPDFESLYPWISALPQMNVHFADPILIRSVLNYDFGDHKLPCPDDSFSEIINSRTSSEISPEQLFELIAMDDPQHLVLQYLGTKTWFWQIICTKDNWGLKMICAVIPESVSAGPARSGISALYAGFENCSLQIIESVFFETLK